MRIRAIRLMLGVITGTLLAPDSISSSTGAEFFETKIRPVLAEHCYSCHSADADKIKAGLRVDARAELLKGGRSGPAIVPGKPTDSLLITAITHSDPELKMPPKTARLSEPIIADLTKWVRDGAEWPEGLPPFVKAAEFNLDERKKKQPWLWQAPRPQTIPVVQNNRWPLVPEDFFILHKLEQHRIEPAPPADDRVWLRRVHFAITGLPPTREDTRSFVSDARTDARERVVDRLLASARFGERWARHWMDLMRYAESRGHESDFLIANAWQYRNYLICALNDDVPYNQFVLEHLAGDLLPAPRLRAGTQINESVLATGWAFLGEENHSPVDIRADECERLDNKVDVFSKTFLGLTVACARCHDHKFDPISAQDYYALSGFMLSSSYRQVRFEAMENNRKIADELDQLRAEFAPRLAKQIGTLSRTNAQNIAENLLQASAIAFAETSGESVDRQLRPWVDHLRDASTNQSSVLHSFAQKALGRKPERSRAGEFVLPKGATLIADYTRPHRQAWKVDGEAFGRRPAKPGDVILTDDPAAPIARIMTYGAARRDPFWNPLKAAPGNENDSGRLGATARAGQMLRTPTFNLGTGKLHYLIRGKTRVYAAVDSHLMLEGPLHGILTKQFDSGPETRLRWVTHDLSEYSRHRAHLEFAPDGASELEILMVVDAPTAPEWMPATQFEWSGSLEAWARAFQEAAVGACDALDQGKVTSETALVANWLVQNAALLRDVAESESPSLGDEFVAAQREIASRAQWESHTAVAWFDGTGVDENILFRGKSTSPGPIAPRALPAAFGSSTPITSSTSSGRYDLARQMIDPENPLIARVFVNRVWHHVFGRGIVASVDNFGELGDRPSHPELLDHIAWHFMHEDGWSLKRLIKRLVLSQTFAMSSVSADADDDERDPSNLLLHRMPVRRLEGEAIRDALLAVSGRLSSTLGGPPEPMHLTEFLVGRGRPEKSGPLDGSGRRSVYMATRRNFLPTFMQTFDAPTPFSTVGRRNVTNLPSQSLAMMNDPLVHEQAGVWARRLLCEMPEVNDRSRVNWLFESAYARLATERELAASCESLAELRRLQNGDEGIWTEFCHALFNSNEFIYLR